MVVNGNAYILLAGFGVAGEGDKIMAVRRPLYSCGPSDNNNE